MRHISLGAYKALVGAFTLALASLTSTTASATISTTWNEVGYPWDAAKIAACSPSKIFAMNNDHSLYVNYDGGVDGQWQYITTPGSAASLACDGNDLIVMNYDKTIWQAAFDSNGNFDGWIEYTAAGSAMTIGGGPGVITALNTDQSIWSSTADGFPGQSWWYRGVAGDAARFAGFQAWSGYNPWGLANNVARFFALNYDGSLWFNDGIVIDDPGTWRPYSTLPSSTAAGPAEISAASPTELFVLDTTAHLWTATTPSLPSSVNFTINPRTSFGDYAVGNITISQNGNWSISSAYIQFAQTSTNTIGYTLQCTAAGLTVNWGGQVGFNIFTPPTENLTGSGNVPALADNWLGVVNVSQNLPSASCTLSVGDLTGSSGGTCPSAGPPGCNCTPQGTCNSGAVCDGDTCIACGQESQPCCANNTCSGSLRCQVSSNQGNALSCL